MKITVYGPGCKNCVNLVDNAKAAAEELGINYQLEKVEDMAEIAKAGIMETPALGIDGEIKVKGRVINKDKIKELLE